MMLNSHFAINTLLNIRGRSMSISTIQNASKTDVVSLMLQTGYLTIDTWSPYGVCTLRFPNHEVRQSFLEIIKVGVNYETSTRMIDDWEISEV